MGRLLKFSLILVAILFVSANYSAINLDIEDELVIDPDVSPSYTTTDVSCSTERVKFNYTNKQGEFLEKNVNQFELHNRLPEQPGAYNLTVFCADNEKSRDSEEIYFQNVELSFDTSEIVYSGRPEIRNLELDIKGSGPLKEPIESFKDTQSFEKLEIEVGGQKFQFKDINVLDQSSLTLNSIEGVSKPSKKNLEVKAVLERNNKKVSISKEKQILVSPVRFEYDSVYLGDNGGFSKVSSNQLRNAEIRFDAFSLKDGSEKVEKGLDPSEFTLSAEDGTTLELGIAGSQANTYRFTVESYPSMDIGDKKEFKLRYEKGEKIGLGSFEVVKQARLRGEVLNGNGEPVYATSRTLGGADFREITLNEGRFDEFFDKSQLDNKLHFRFDESNITFDDFIVGGQKKRNIYYEIDESIKPYEIDNSGIEPLTVIGFRTDYQFSPEKTLVGMDYNDSKIERGDEIMGYQCTNIDIESMMCLTSWEEVDVEHDRFENRITFKGIDTVRDGSKGLRSGFMAAKTYEKPEIKLDNFKLGKKELNIEDTLTAEGNLVSSDEEKSLEDTNVTLKLQKYDSNISKLIGYESSSDTTNGVFSFTPFDVPDEAGTYKVRLIAEKENFKKLNKTVSEELKIDIRKGLELNGDNSLTIEKGTRETTSFTLRNTGQVKLKDLELSINQLSNDRYSLSTRSIDELDAGEERSITLTVLLTQGICGETCENLEFSLEAESKDPEGEILKTNMNYMVDVKTPQKEKEDTNDNRSQEATEANTNEEKKQSENTNGLEKLTGSFMASDSGQMMAVGVIGVLVILVAAGAKLRKKKSDHPDTEIDSEKNEQEERGLNISELKSLVKNKPDDEVDEKDEKKVEGAFCPKCGKRFDTSIALGLHLDSIDHS